MRQSVNFVLLILAVFLTACATPGSLPVKGTPDMDQQAKRFASTPDKARIYVFRNNYFGNIFTQSLQVNGVNAGSLTGYSFMPLEVAAGKYKLFARSENETTLELQVQSGKNYFVQLNASMGVWTFRSELRLVAEAEGRQAILDECTLVTSSLYPLSNDKAPATPDVPSSHAPAPATTPSTTLAPATVANPALAALLQVRPASGYASPEDIEHLPAAAKYRSNYERFLANPKPTKALVLGEDGGFFSNGSGSLAELHQLFERCHGDGHQECWLYSWGKEVVWSTDKAQRISRAKLMPLPR